MPQGAKIRLQNLAYRAPVVKLDQEDTVLALINALPIAAAVVDGSGYFVSGNEAFQTLWRLEKQYFDTQPTLSSFLDDLRNQGILPEQNNFVKFRARVKAQAVSKTESSETWHLPDGAALKIKFVPLSTDWHLFSIENLTPQLAIGRTLNELAQTHQATLNHLQEGLAVFKSNGLLKFHNPAFSSIWQLPEDVFLSGLHMTDFLDGTRKLLPVLENWPTRRVTLSGRLLGRKKGVALITCNTGVILEAANIPLPDGSVLLRYANITDSVNLEKTLKMHNAEILERTNLLAETSRLKSEFLANLSNEISTPLTSISSFAKLLAGEYCGSLNKRQQEYADGILSATEGVSGLIHDIMDLGSVEAGLLEVNNKSVYLHNYLTNVIEQISERAQAKKIKIKFDCPINIGWINADDKRFKQCLLHLLRNAINFSGSGSTITITVKRGLEGVRIDIQDTGVGIPKDYLVGIFKGFERSAASGSLPAGGGVGLALVKAFIELQGGSVEIASKPNQGTTVSLFFPDKLIV